MTHLLWRTALRDAVRYPWQIALSLLGITLGVAVVFAVDLAGQSAQRAFDTSMASLLGETTHQVIGGPAGFDESVYRRLRVEAGLRRSAPVVEGFVQLRDETVRLLGIDPLAEAGFRQRLAGTDGLPIRELMIRPRTVLLSASNARRHGIAPGDRVRLEVGGAPAEVQVLEYLDPEAGPPVADLMVSDIATAQEMLGRIGRVDRIDLILDEGEVGAVEASLPPGLRLVDAAGRTETTRELTRAFRINLTAMSLLALVVGGFLIYNTMTFAVLRRRNLLGTLRVLGVTRGETAVLVLGEAAVLGALGTAAGLAAGWVLGEGLVRLVTRTINDLYFVLAVTGLSPSPMSFAKAIALGLGATLLAAAFPARAAARTQPRAVQRRSTVESGSEHRAPLLALAGAALVALGALLAWWPSPGLLPGFAALFFIMVGSSLGVPAVVLATSRLAAAPLSGPFGALGRLAARGVAASLSRSGMAIAALTIAVAATVGMGVMVDSFRRTVTIWLSQTLQSDVYVSAPSAVSARTSGTLPRELAASLGTLPGVAAVSTARRAEIESPLGPVLLTVLDPAPRSLEGFLLKRGAPDRFREAFTTGEAVLISEAFTYRHDKTVGDTVVLLTETGEREFPVAGVFFDYETDRGRVVMHRATYDRHWDDPHISSAGLYVQEGVDADAVAASVRDFLAPLDRSFRVRSEREILERSLQIFDQTFEVTRVLRLLALAVAFIGVLSALMALQLERAREHAILRATGVTPGELFAMVGGQTGLMGAIAGLLALPLGLVIAWVLVLVINKRSFGWTVQIHVPPDALLEGGVLAVVAALAAGIYPAWRMARTPPAEALREE